MEHKSRVSLPAPPDDFPERLAELSPEPLADESVKSLVVHGEELARWSQAVGLVVAAGWGELLERHYGESLAGLTLLSRSCRTLVDLGSGAGFPGWILAASRPGLCATLVESRERKWAFLRAVSRKAGLSVKCLNARVAESLPEGLPERIDAVSARAVRFPATTWRALAERLSPGGQVLLWVGKEAPPLPSDLRVQESMPLSGAHHRRILALERCATRTGVS